MAGSRCRKNAWRLRTGVAVCLSVYAGALAAAETEGPAGQARKILEATGVRGGLVVHLGCGDGRLTAALRADNRICVHGLDKSKENVEKARKYIGTRGVCGVSVQQWTSDRLPYAENMVNLLVVEDAGGVDAAERMRVLVPGGVAYCLRSGAWNKTVKPWPKEIDEWTHWLHGADANAVARDTVAGPPRRLQWIAGPLWSRHHHTIPSVTGIVSSGGRLFSIVDEAPAAMDGSVPDKWALVARDAFNGLPLWRKPIADWGWKSWSATWICRFTIPTHIPRRLVAAGDRVYVTLGFNAPLTELDAATGEVLKTYEGTERTDEILYHDGLLILAINQADQRPGKSEKDRRGDEGDPPVRKWVAAIRADTGEMLWKTGDYVGLRSKTGSMERISHLSMCAGDGQVFFADGDRIVSLSLKDGRELWRIARPEVPENKMRYDIRITDMCTLVYGDGRLFFVQLNPDRGIDWREILGKLHVYDAKTGDELWSRPCASWGWGHPADVFLIDGLVWVDDYKSFKRTASECRPGSAASLAKGNAWVGSPNSFCVGLDPATGEIKRKISNFRAFNNGHHHRCYRNKATPRFKMTSFRGLEFIPFDGGETLRQHWVRGTCRLGAIPCNGLVYATPHPCDCYITSKLNGFVALAPENKAESRKQKAEEESARLERGPAYGKTPPQLSAFGFRLSEDWPTWRHDCERTGATAAAVSETPEPAWRADVGAAPTGCIAVGETVFAAVPSRHQVVALNAADGKPRWTFTADGRIDTPPTFAAGRLYFGGMDGWLYCLRASDGELVWRFRGAPEPRLVGAFGGVESAWPIHGSVVVRDGAVYCTAGRSSFLDGGIVAWSLDAETGRVLSEKRIASSHTMDVDNGRSQKSDSGLLSDVLVARADGIYMRRRKLFGGEQKSDAPPLYSTAGFLDDGWSSRVRWHLGDRPVAEYLVYRGKTVYAVRARQKMSGYGEFFTPGGKGYELFCTGPKDAKAPGKQDQPAAKPKAKRAKSKKPQDVKKWSLRVPVKITSMVLAGDTLFAAGSPDVIDKDEPWAAYDGKRGGVLMAVSAADGRVLMNKTLDAPTVLEGLSAARGRLFVSTASGEILCFQ